MDTEPLASKIRPKSLGEFVGQQHLVGQGKPLRIAIEQKHLFSFVLWGPPGVGKTTLARIYAKAVNAEYFELSAVSAGKDDIKKIVGMPSLLGQPKILFLDEIHRFNKAQQDYLLPFVETGKLYLIGATTENPSFEVIPALLSRCRVFTLSELGDAEIKQIINRTKFKLDKKAQDWLVNMANGDARQAIAMLENTAKLYDKVTIQTLKDTLQSKYLRYDKAGEEHFNLISALHKSVRSSDPDAALYWLARMLESGEDRMYIARRLVRMAVEDIVLADPRALEQAVACMQAVHLLGEPEGDQALAQAAIYLAAAPKSDAAYRALSEARETARQKPADPVPLHLRNAPTRAMKEWGYGEGYEHAHSRPGALTAMPCLPDWLRGRRFYEPSDRGVEARIRQRLEEIRNWIAAARGRE